MAYINQIAYQGSDDPRKIAANNRARIASMGDVLNQENLDKAGEANQQSADYLNFTNPIERQMAQGQGGYTDQEKQDITGQFNPDQLNADLAGSQQKQDQSVGYLQGGLDNTISNNYDALKQDPNLAPQIADSMNKEAYWAGQGLSYERGGLEQGVSDERASLEGAIDPSKLGLSNQFSSNYLMTPEEQQRIATGAGISAGLKDSQAVGDLQRSAAAAGSSPMGVAAYRARLARQQAADSGDALTQARIGASNEAAGRRQQMEAMRLGTEQDISSRQMQSANEIGSRTQQNVTGIGTQAQALTETLGQQQRDAEMQAEQNRQSAQQYLTGAELQAKTTAGEAGIQNAQTSTGQKQQQNQYNTGTGVNLQTGIANTRLGGTYTGLQSQDTKQAQSNQNEQAALARQQQTYATSAGNGNSAANIGLAASQTPSTFDKISGAAIGAAGAAAGFLDEGGVVDEPTTAVIGEQGPEAVIPINQPWYKRLGQQPGFQSTMQNASRMATGGNPLGGLATAGAGLAGGILANRRQNQAWDQTRKGGVPGLGPQTPPPFDPSTGYLPSSVPDQGMDNQSPMARGQIVTRPTVAKLGEAGPEAVIPLNNKPGNKVRPSMLFNRRAYGQAA